MNGFNPTFEAVNSRVGFWLREGDIVLYTGGRLEAESVQFHCSCCDHTRECELDDYQCDRERMVHVREHDQVAAWIIGTDGGECKAKDVFGILRGVYRVSDYDNGAPLPPDLEAFIQRESGRVDDETIQEFFDNYGYWAGRYTFETPSVEVTA